MPAGGTVAIGNNSAFSTSAVTFQNAVTIFASGGARTIANNFSISTSGVLTIGGSNDFTLNGSLTGTGGSRTLTVNNSANTTLAGNVFITDTATAGRTLTLNGTGNLTISGVIANNSTNNAIADNLTFNGTGTLTLSGANTYTGTTIVGSSGGANAGTLQLSGSGLISNAATAVFGGTLDLNGTTQTITTLDLGGGASGSTATVTIGAGELKLGGTVTYSQTNNPNGATISGIGGGKLSLNGTRSFAVQDSSAAANDLTVSAIIQDGSASSGITKTSAGTLLLSGANTYTGKTTISNGTLSVGSIGSVGSTSSNLGAPTTIANGTIDLGSGGGLGQLTYTGTGETTDRVINMAGTTGGSRIDQSGTGLLKFTSDLTATGNGIKTLTLQGSTAGTGEISGAIVNNSGTNTTSLTKAGTGTWTLSGTNTYTGATTVNGGTLLINGSTAAGSAVAVNNTGTLGGTGTISGAVTVNAGGTIAPGASVGILTLSSTATFVGTDGSNLATYAVDILGATSDKLVIGGALNLSNLFDQITFSGTPDGTTTYVLATYTSVSGTFDFASVPSGYELVYGTTELDLTPVPEPGTWVAGALALGAIAFSQRRRFARVRAK